MDSDLYTVDNDFSINFNGNFTLRFFSEISNFFDLFSSVVSRLYPSYHLSTDGKGQSLKLGPRKALFHGNHGLAMLLKI